MSVSPPSSVKAFEMLILAYCLLSAMDFFIQWHGNPAVQQATASASQAMGETAFIAISLGVSLGLNLLLALLASRGRKNWARIVLTVLCCIGLYQMIAPLSALWQLDPMMASFSLVTHGVHFLALAMLFTPASHAWFAKRPAL